MNKKHQGAFSEHKAICWLLEQGYEVFRNVSQHGAVDLIARDTDTGEYLPIDVKTGYFRDKQDGTRSYYTSGHSETSKIRHLLYIKEEDRLMWATDRPESPQERRC